MKRLMKYHTKEQVKTVLIEDESVVIEALIITDTGLIVETLPQIEGRYMTETSNGKSVEGLLEQYRDIGNRIGMSAAAEAFLS